MPRVINESFELVELNRLKKHPSNPNQGDFGAIQESVQTNGFYGAIVANKRNGKILAGNHRYDVAKAEKFDTVPVIWVDVDEDEELRILLADNRTARLGTDDESKLAELLAELATTHKGLSGTGFDGDDLDRLINDLAGIHNTTDDDTTPQALKESFMIMVTCDSEIHQTQLLESFTNQGLQCRALMS